LLLSWRLPAPPLGSVPDSRSLLGLKPAPGWGRLRRHAASLRGEARWAHPPLEGRNCRRRVRGDRSL